MVNHWLPKRARIGPDRWTCIIIEESAGKVKNGVLPPRRRLRSRQKELRGDACEPGGQKPPKSTRRSVIEHCMAKRQRRKRADDHCVDATERKERSEHDS